MVNKTRAEVQARQALRDMDLIQRRGRAAARQISTKIRNEVVRAFRQRNIPNIANRVVDKLLPLTLDVMATAHLRGMQREYAILEEGLGLRLSIFDNALAALSKSLELDSDQIRRKYRAAGFKVLNNLSSDMEKKLRETVFDLVETGAPVREAVGVLGDRFDELGLAPTADYRLEAVFRTQSQIAYNAGRWSADQDEAVQEILWGYTYVAVGDARTRETHQKINGIVLPKDDPRWKRFWPPNGWNCRCAVIPVFDEEDLIEPADDIEPDEGFSYNSGMLFGTAA